MLKFRFNKPAKIPVPGGDAATLMPVPFRSKFPGIPIDHLIVADHVPKDEASKLKYYVYQVQVFLYKVFSPMQRGLAQIDADSERALAAAYSAKQRKYFPAPQLPQAFVDEPDLGALAVCGPYAGYLHKADEGYQWDLRQLNQFEHHAGLHPLGVRVLFTVDAQRKLQPVQIDCDLGVCKPGEDHWPRARDIALCAISTHTALVRHFNGVHLIAGGPIALATRNLPPNHPLCRLLWPHIYGTQYSNEIVTLGQMAKGGDFDTTFSFTHKGMCDLFESSVADYSLIVNDPERDAQQRGITDGTFDTPTVDNLSTLFAVMQRHTLRYLQAYYATEDALQEDPELQSWLNALETMLPNGIQAVLQGEPTRESLARLLANCIYLGSVEHEILGTGLWNYQLWVRKQPVRVYKDGSREPLDVYQRLVNANFNLNVNRAKLMDDYTYLALDDKGVAAFNAFREELAELQRQYAQEKPELWRITPKILEANMNA